MIRSARVRNTILTGAVAALVLGTPALPAFADDDGLTTVFEGLDGPRGVAALSGGRTMVTEADGTFSLVVQRDDQAPKVTELGRVETELAPAIDVGPNGRVYILTTAGGEPGAPLAETAAKLFLWRSGWAEPKLVADIAAYQQEDPDPYDLEELPSDSNPYGVQALRDGTVLVADAAGNDLLRVYRNGRIETVAVLKPRVVPMPEGLPSDGPFGPLPPAGTMLPSEAVATSVTVGADGYWYVGELRGFPATPGTSQIWRIRPGSVGAVCDPETPNKGRCRRYVDGLTSITDLAAESKRKIIYALSLSKASWLQMELGAEGSEIGGLFKITRRWNDAQNVFDTSVHELAAGQLVLPGGVDAEPRGNDLKLVGPLFGPGSLMELDQ